jgi:hypothetical protein
MSVQPQQQNGHFSPSPSFPRLAPLASVETAPAHSTPLSVPTSNAWQSKFKSTSLNLGEDSDEDEPRHRVVANRSPVREENDEEDASESEQFFKSPPVQSKAGASSSFFGSKFKSTKSKPQSSVQQTSWRDELEEDEPKPRVSSAPKTGDDGEHNPTSGGWQKRKKKNTKKKSSAETEGTGDRTGDRTGALGESDSHDVERGRSGAESVSIE